MACKACAQTRDAKAAFYLQRAATLLREAADKDGVDRSAVLNRISEALQNLPDLPPRPIVRPGSPPATP